MSPIFQKWISFLPYMLYPNKTLFMFKYVFYEDKYSKQYKRFYPDNTLFMLNMCLVQHHIFKNCILKLCGLNTFYL